MKVYFAGAIYGGREKLKNYLEIQKIIEKLGHQFLTVHVTGVGMRTEEALGRTPAFSYNRDTQLIRKADCLIAEITLPSLGVGYELCYAVEKRKIPVLALYEEGAEHRISAMIRGISQPNFRIRPYNFKNLEMIIKDFFKSFSQL